MKQIPYLDNDERPHRNKSLKNLKVEKWEAIPVFEEYFQIPNLGRIKSLARDIYCYTEP